MDLNPLFQGNLERFQTTCQLLSGRALLCVSARRMMIGHIHMLLQTVLRSMDAATTTEAGLNHLQQRVPDLVLVSESLEGGTTGMAFIRTLKERYPRLPCLLLLEHETPDVLQEALACGSDGICLERLVGTGHVNTALKAILDGGIYMDAPLLAVMRQGSSSSMDDDKAPLTARERDVLCKLVQGCGNAEIAAKLFVSVETVRTHMKAIRRKLGARDRSHAALIAVTSGLVRWQTGAEPCGEPQ